MTKRMLIDSTHAEETRVVVLDGNRLEDFDVETSTKRQLKGNIYLAKVVRVEPSLQAAFVEYGGGRHGFLAFGEIHPDYYQIPVADRQRLLEMQAEEARREEEEEDRAAAAEEAGETISANVREIEISDAEPETIEHGTSATAAQSEYSAGNEGEAAAFRPAEAAEPLQGDIVVSETVTSQAVVSEPEGAAASEATGATLPGDDADQGEEPAHGTRAQPAAIEHESVSDTVEALTSAADEPQPEFAFAAATPVPETYADEGRIDEAQIVDSFQEEPFQAEQYRGDQEQPSDSGDDQREQRIPPRFLRNYKIQEVIKRRQILLIQVVKEERGADHLYLPRGPVLRADAELAARRRHFPQDHLRRRPPPPEGDHRRAWDSQGDGPDRAHRRRAAAEARDHPRLRIPDAVVGRHPRAHDEVGGPGADL